MREFVRAEATRLGVDPDVAALVASELATNVVRHAGTDYHVRMERTGQTVRLSVRDGSAVFPAVRDLSLGGGFGLRVVEGLASRWGVDLLASGKEVWAELSAPSAEGRTTTPPATP